MGATRRRHPPGVERDADPVVKSLAELFRAHPVWQRAAEHLSGRAASGAYFVHRPGEAWTLERHAGRTRLVAGTCDDPDLVFRFSAGAVRRLQAVEGDVADFAIALFECILARDPDEHVDLRIAASFGRLLRRGYVRLLLAAGPRLLAFGAAHGVRDVGALRDLVAALRRRTPAPWERAGRGPHAG